MRGHRAAVDELVGVVVPEGEGVRGLGALVGDGLDAGELRAGFLHGKGSGLWSRDRKRGKRGVLRHGAVTDYSRGPMKPAWLASSQACYFGPLRGPVEMLRLGVVRGEHRAVPGGSATPAVGESGDRLAVADGAVHKAGRRAGMTTASV